MDIFGRLEAQGVSVSVEPESVDLKSTQRPYAFIEAELSRHYEGYISLDIQMFCDEFGSKDPSFIDFRASDLARASINHIVAHSEVKGIAFWWQAPPDYILNTDTHTNYSNYVSSRNKFTVFGHNMEEARRLAALSTWTAKRIAIPSGFSTVKDITESYRSHGSKPYEIKGFFVKPLE